MKLVNALSTMLSATVMSAMALVAYAEVQDIKTQQAQEDFREQHQCLAMNIYHEARGDSRLGQKAVGWVTLNRVMHDSYPDTVCDVVYQARLDSRGNPRRNQCQFSWFCDGKSDTPRDEAMWAQIQYIAYEVLESYGVVDDFTEGAIMYHASYVNPYWADSYERTVRIDTHIFYK
jgi:spore germination cell wall hydrolase CwlJ-like protein